MRCQALCRALHCVALSLAHCERLTPDLSMVGRLTICICSAPGHMQVGQLEADKARLMDRLEELTGEPLGSLLEPVALAPAASTAALLGAAAPAGDGARKGDSAADEKKALSSIVRMAAAPGGTAAGRVVAELARSRRGYAATPQEALAAVRRLRAEREALRKRLFELLPQLSGAERYRDAREELRRVGHAVGTMEQFVGGMNSEVASGAPDCPALSRVAHCPHVCLGPAHLPFCWCVLSVYLACSWLTCVRAHMRLPRRRSVCAMQTTCQGAWTIWWAAWPS